MTAALLFVAAILGGAIAALSGFGIGSVLTPLLALSVGTKQAVVAVSIPHLVATAFVSGTCATRLIAICSRILALPAPLADCWAHGWARASAVPILAYILGGLLVFAGFMGLTGLSKKMRFGKKIAWLGGALSGLLGGLVGNQGGIRSAAMLGFNLEAKTFVATATAIALIVDGARMPIYFFTSPETVHRLGALDRHHGSGRHHRHAGWWAGAGAHP